MRVSRGTRHTWGVGMVAPPPCDPAKGAVGQQQSVNHASSKNVSGLFGQVSLDVKETYWQCHFQTPSVHIMHIIYRMAMYRLLLWLFCHRCRQQLVPDIPKNDETMNGKVSGLHISPGGLIIWHRQNVEYITGGTLLCATNLFPERQKRLFHIAVLQRSKNIWHPWWALSYTSI